jgi:hypothetical protein
MPSTLAVITPVASQPSQFSGPSITKRSITSVRRTIIISRIITGTARMPLITALQYSAVIGSIGEKFRMMPTSAASDSTA